MTTECNKAKRIGWVENLMILMAVISVLFFVWLVVVVAGVFVTREGGVVSVPVFLGGLQVFILSATSTAIIRLQLGRDWKL